MLSEQLSYPWGGEVGGVRKAELAEQPLKLRFMRVERIDPTLQRLFEARFPKDGSRFLCIRRQFLIGPAWGSPHDRSLVSGGIGTRSSSLGSNFTRPLA